MGKSATDVMHEILFAAVVDAIVALKAASKGVPNTLLRDLNAVHANTTVADLPKELQATIDKSVRAAFTRLLKEGYSVSPEPSGLRNPPIRPAAAGRPAGAGSPPPKHPKPGSRTPMRGAPRQKPKPGSG
jgi:hypothetical protein